MLAFDYSPGAYEFDGCYCKFSGGNFYIFNQDLIIVKTVEVEKKDIFRYLDDIRFKVNWHRKRIIFEFANMGGFIIGFNFKDCDFGVINDYEFASKQLEQSYTVSNCNSVNCNLVNYNSQTRVIQILQRIPNDISYILSKNTNYASLQLQVYGIYINFREVLISDIVNYIMQVMLEYIRVNHTILTSV